ncbi:hypothetical protein ACVWZV_002098 [Bradyrhizobium sp. GM5.1]
MALRIDEVMPPNTMSTLSRWISLRTLPTATDSFEAVSSTKSSSGRPSRPPPALISLDHHLGDVGVGIAGVGNRPGEVGGDADLDRGFGRIGPGRRDHPTADAGCDCTGGKGEIRKEPATGELRTIGHVTKPLFQQ